jgi:hypothetical protein
MLCSTWEPLKRVDKMLSACGARTLDLNKGSERFTYAPGRKEAVPFHVGVMCAYSQYLSSVLEASE